MNILSKIIDLAESGQHFKQKKLGAYSLGDYTLALPILEFANHSLALEAIYRTLHCTSCLGNKKIYSSGNINPNHVLKHHNCGLRHHNHVLKHHNKVMHKSLFLLKILSLELRSGGLNRSLLHEISIRIHWKYSRTQNLLKTQKSNKI